MANNSDEKLWCELVCDFDFHNVAHGNGLRGWMMMVRRLKGNRYDRMYNLR